MNSLTKLGFTPSSGPLMVSKKPVMDINAARNRFKNHNQSLSRAKPIKQLTLEDSLRQASPALHGLYNIAKKKRIQFGSKDKKFGSLTVGKIGKHKIDPRPEG